MQQLCSACRVSAEDIRASADTFAGLLREAPRRQLFLEVFAYASVSNVAEPSHSHFHTVCQALVAVAATKCTHRKSGAKFCQHSVVRRVLVNTAAG